MEISKIYENVALQRIRGIDEIRRALVIVELFVKMQKLPLYGGMAIDYALKLNGHEGIYTDDLIPDYDFFSPDSLSHSYAIALVLAKENYPLTNVINAIHPTTRKVRIDKAHAVADVSYMPLPYFDRIPLLNYKSFIIVHPDFQRIDLHRSLSLLYEGAPRENWRNRMSKDVKRLLLLDKYCPMSSHESADSSIFKDRFIDIFNCPCEVDCAKAIAQLDDSVCITGDLAYYIYMRITGGDVIEKCNIVEVLVNDFDSFELPPDCEFYNKTFDIFADSAVCSQKKTVYYNNDGQLVSAGLVSIDGRNYKVANIHYVMASLLYKYFMLRNIDYLNKYNNCRSIIAKQSNISKYANVFGITGYYFGKTNFTIAHMLHAQKHDCALKGSVYKDKPIITFNVNSAIPDIDVSQYVGYQIDGSRISARPVKSYKCPT